MRAAQARETRRIIVSAAARLFVDQGFGRTSIDAIAEEAGVSRQTVFTAAGGKVELLKLALDWTIVGDDEPVALEHRPAVRATKQATDPDAILRGWVEIVTEIASRVAGLSAALAAAAAATMARGNCGSRPRRNASPEHEHSSATSRPMQCCAQA